MNQAKSNPWTGPDAFVPCTMPIQHLSLPAEHEIHLWYLHLGVLGGALKSALSGDAHSQADTTDVVRLNIEQLRFSRNFYVRVLLGAYLDLPGKDVAIGRSRRGKPELDKARHDTQLKFSTAKSEDRLLLGVATTEQLGVDLEPSSRKAKNALGLAERYFSPAEFLALREVDPERTDEAFLRAWALNEAVVKASGLGIANQLCRFTLDMDPDAEPSMLDIEDDTAANWSLSLVRPSQDFIGAVASRQVPMNVSCFQLLPAVGPAIL